MNRELDTAEAPATYEVHLSGPLPPALCAAFPGVTTSQATAETVLIREVHEGTELDVLLDQLLFMGLVLSEVHEHPPAVPLPRDATTGSAQRQGSR